MKRNTIAIFGILFLTSAAAHADQRNSMMRGGFGFLYGDNNSFSNPGQFSVSHGIAAELEYTRTTQSQSQGVSPSIVFGNGAFGLGVGATRSGATLSSSAASTDEVNVGVGFSPIKERLTFGLGYSRVLGSGYGNTAVVDGTLTLSGPQHMGPSLGLGVGSTVEGAPSARSATLAAGYSFKSNTTLEGRIELHNLSATRDFTAAFDTTFGGQSVYVGLGYRWLNLTSQHQGAARLGFLLGRYIDMSVLASSVLASGSDVVYGVTLRATF